MVIEQVTKVMILNDDAGESLMAENQSPCDCLKQYTYC